MEIIKLNLSEIKIDKEQPRKTFQDIGNLASSILKEGLLEPLKVRKEGTKYILIDGERRFKALTLLAKEDKIYNNINCIILKPKEIFFTQLSTDLHKNKLTMFEEAEAFKQLLEEGYNLEDLKARLGIETQYITRRIKLLGLNKKTQELIKEGKIAPSIVTSIDFNNFKNNEEAILNRINKEININSKNNKREQIQRIIREETQKEEAILNHLRIDIETFSKLINQYEFKLDEFKLDEFKLDEFIGYSINETQKHLDKVLWKVQQLIGIKERLIILKNKLDIFKNKYGGNTELDEKLISNIKQEVKGDGTGK